MARRSKVEMQHTREALIASARKAFTQHGFAQTSMEELCKDVGLTRGALYHHFGDKKGLLEAVVVEIDQELDLRLQQAFEQAENEWLGFQARCHLFLQMAQEVEVQRIILKDARSVIGQYPIDTTQQCVKTLSEILTKLMHDNVIHSTDAQALAVLIQGSLSDASFWIADSEQAAQRLKHAQTALQLLLNGLKVQNIMQ